ncbi:MAG: transporter [Gemmatimonadaceae bacterium]
MTAACLAAAGCVRPSLATLDPIVTDRPDFTESTDAVPRGTVQVESGATHNRTARVTSQSVGEVLVRLGMTSRSEFRVALNSYTIEHSPGSRASGWEDVAVGAKLKLANGGGTGSWSPALALLAATTLPTGASAFRQDELQPEMKFAQAWSITTRASFSSNINYSWLRSASSNSGEWAASGSFGYTVSPRVGTYAEYFAFIPTAHGAGASQYVNSGFTVGLGPNAQLDARAGIGLRNVSGKDYFVGVGLARRW